MLSDSDRLDLSRDGYVMLRGIFDAGEMAALAARLSAVLESHNEPSVLRSRGRAYGVRNLLGAFPEAAGLLGHPTLGRFATEILGPRAGIVRALYFDKPPDRSWSLPWHKDRTIAVKNNHLRSEHFRKPTVKAGIPHIEAPPDLLERMLTLRVHLDAMGEQNGPLCVIPGSHQRSDPEQMPSVELHANAGDVLAMRPLLSHSSRLSRTGTTEHRRVIHFELARSAELPDGYEWYCFTPLASAGEEWPIAADRTASGAGEAE